MIVRLQFYFSENGAGFILRHVYLQKLYDASIKLGNLIKLKCML